ncbi:metallophosphoesterase [bacterium]|nr:metallophosphoesterase [bacterium]
MSYENDIAKGLAKAYERAPIVEADCLSDRFIVFSDQHKGARDGADDFLLCEQNYNRALAYYFQSGFALAVLGDVEELWENRPKAVLKSYEHSLHLEMAFHQASRYYRFFGNHDIDWSDLRKITKWLFPIFGNEVIVYESLRLKFKNGSDDIGEIYLVHGHQGSAIDTNPVSRFLVRVIWRNLQRIFGWKSNTPSNSIELRGKHNKAMYEWANSLNKKMAVIAGHTHQPIFASLAHTEKLEQELQEAKNRHDEAAIQALQDQIDYQKTKIKRPCYFNSGCCSFSDGDITGIEIADGKIKLVRWSDGWPIPSMPGPKPKVLQEMELKELFNRL